MTQIQSLSHHRRPDYFQGVPNKQTEVLTRQCLYDGMHLDEGGIQNRWSGCSHVMIVQSGAPELQAVTENIRTWGYRVTPVEESGKALLYFGREPCDVLISELDMPRFNGFQLARCIRRHAPQTRILLMTACCKAEVADLMDDRVANGWLFLPFGADVLKNMLEGVLNS